MDQFFDKYSKIPLSLRWLIIVAIPIVIFFVLYFFVYDPKVKELVKKKEASKALEKTYVENAAIRDNLPKFQEEVNILNQQLERAVTLLPNDANVHNLYKQLFVEAEKANIDLLSFKPGNLSRKDFYSELVLDVRLRGSYHRIAEFIDRVGKLDRIVNVNNINFSGQSVQKNETILEMNTIVTTYTFSSGASASAAASSDDKGDDTDRRRSRRRRR
ncbi:MAG: type 4a pilus biogenesis protein PilO [Bdellovibrionales bacterium]|nr:type 4a pilus biogenesis protein PilO [Bdellovibrionales bacterium]